MIINYSKKKILILDPDQDQDQGIYDLLIYINNWLILLKYLKFI